MRALERVGELEGRRALVYGLQQRGASVTILNRTADRARELADALGAAGAGRLADLGHTQYDVLVNTTSVGLRDDASPVAADALASAAVVMDAVYDRAATPLS